MTDRAAQSPYLSSPHRLADVLAAIQAMGNYKFYKLDYAGWADRISGDQTQAAHWAKVFREHPEFFRLDPTKTRASLVWRRQHPKRYHVDEQRQLSHGEFDALPDAGKARVSRIPLDAVDVQSLMATAVELHSRAIEQVREQRWWIPVVASAIGGLLGALVGAAV